MNRKKMKALLVLLVILLLSSGTVYAIQIYTASFNYTVKPVGTAIWNGNPYDLGVLMAGETYTKTYENILTVNAYRTGKATIHFKLNLTKPEDFSNLEIAILDDSNVEIAKLTPTNPEATHEINSPQTMTFTIKITLTVSLDVTEHPGNFQIHTWIT